MKNYKEIIQKINKLAVKIKRNVVLMEVCGTHTQVIAQNAIRKLMPNNVRLITGPGCPVCITAQKDIDAIVSLALEGIPVATYGDVMRVPGYYGSLDDANDKGAKVFSVYSIEEALELQEKYPDLVFFAIGFETTIPMTALAVKNGLTIFSSHRLFLPAMQALLNMGEIKIDGFINPGHVSTIIGVEPYKKLNVSQVIAGFTSNDVLETIYMLLKQIQENRRDVENEYIRLVRKNGNPVAYKLIFEVFNVVDGEWRGFGNIPQSGLKIKNKYKKFDAKIKYKKILDQVDFSFSQKSVACICGEIIRGLKEPQQCPLFKKVCHPENPIGPCMVSIEGACNVFFRFH